MRWLAACGAILGWFSLALQLAIVIGSAHDTASAGAAVAAYFSFFTILTNILVALVFTFTWLPGSHRIAGFFSAPRVQSSAAVYIAIVGATYFLLLRHLWNPQGAQKIADVILHDFNPVFYGIFWFFFVPKRGLRAADAVTWLGFPLAYSGYVLLRGAIFNTYPYPFIDVGVLGYGLALRNAALFVGVFLAVGLLVVWIGRVTDGKLRFSGSKRRLSIR